SGGQQQRIAVARALIFEPGLVLMDEPLGALDKQLREQMQYELKDIHARLGVTFVYVTHDQTEALTMSDRIAVFSAGTIQQLSDPTALYENPQNDFVAGFIGENNRLEGMVEDTEEGGVVLRLGKDVLVKASALGPSARVKGRRAVLSVRPERVTVLEDGAGRDNVLSAAVRQVVYVGDHRRVVCAIPEVGPIIAQVPNDSAFRKVSAGETVR